MQQSSDIATWQRRIDAIWSQVENIASEDLVETIDALAAERPPQEAAASFERACARDSAGREHEAEPLYRAALASTSLDDFRRARATIQLASTLRIIGQLDESESLLLTELERRGVADEKLPLRDEAKAILALTYVAQGRAREAAGLALWTLAPHLSRYRRSVRGNAEELIVDARPTCEDA